MDVSRFNFVPRSEFTAPIVSQDQVLQNLDNMNKAASLRYLGDNVYYNSTFQSSSHDPSRVMNKNYAQNYPQTENFHTHPQKHQSFNKKSKFSKRNKHESRKILTTKHIEIDSNENTGILSAEIEREQEYQDQMNMIYNDPQYLEKYYNQLQYQPELHFNVEHQSCAPMFYLPLQQQQQPQFQEDKTLQEQMETSSEVSSELSSEVSSKDGFQVESENSSDYYSDSANSSDTEDDDSESVDEERSSLFNTNFITSDNSSTDNCLHHDDDDSFLELDEELNNLVLSIITE